MWRFVTALVTGALAISLPIGSAAAQQRLELKLTTSPTIFDAAYKKVIDRFEAAHPDIKINVISSVRDFDEIVQQTLRAGLIGDLPDVSIQGSNRVQPLAERGFVVPLEPLIKNDPTWSSFGFSPAATEIGKVRGQVYALGIGFSTPILLYNVDLVRRAGADPDNLPKDWPGAIELARKIAATGPDTVGGLFQYGSSGNWTFLALLESFGGAMATADDKAIAFDSPAGLKALQVLRAFGEAGQSKADMTREQARQAFASGKLGFMIDASSFLAAAERQAAGRFPIRVAPMPIPSAEGRIPAAGAAIVLFAMDPARQQAAWKFMKFFAGAEAQTIIAKDINLVPVNQTAISDPAYLGDFYKERPNAAVSVSQASIAGPWYSFPGANSVKITSVIADYLSVVVRLRQSPEEAMAGMKRDVEALLVSQ
jgi:multiple sugar transport system substrate-binding protein